MICFLGCGLLGSAMVRAALRRGEKPAVWNRTLEKAARLAREGAVAYPLVEDAVAQASAVHLVLSDDSAVDAILQKIVPALPKGVTLFDHTTTSITGARRRTQELAAQGIEYLHVPVFMSPQNALEGEGVLLFCGKKEQWQRHESYLARFAKQLLYLGEDPGRAAALKLAGNLLLVAITAGIADMASLLKGAGIERSAITQLFAVFDPGKSIKPRAQRMLGGNYSSPSWQLQMARKDVRLMLEEAEKNQLPLQFIPQVAAVMDRKIAAGKGHLDWTVIGEDFI